MHRTRGIQEEAMRNVRMVNCPGKNLDNKSMPNQSKRTNYYINGILKRVHNQYVDILKRLDPFSLREIYDSPSLAGVVVRLHMVIQDFPKDISRFLFNHLEIQQANTADLQWKLKRLISYVRLVCYLHVKPLSSTPMSGDSLKGEVKKNGKEFQSCFETAYSQIRKLEGGDGDMFNLYLQIMRNLREEYLWAGHSLTLTGFNNQHLTTLQHTPLSRVRRPNLTQENIVDRVIDDLDSLNEETLERMDMKKYEPYFDAILIDVETGPRCLTEYKFLTLLLKRLENTEIDRRTKLMVGFVSILSWKRFNLDTLNTVERRQILFNFRDIVARHVEAVQTLPEKVELIDRLSRLKEIYMRRCILPRDLFDDVNFDPYPPIREISRTSMGAGYSSQRKRDNRVDLMNPDPKADLIKAFSTKKCNGHEGLVMINQLVKKFADRTSAPGLFKRFFKDSIKLNNDCKKALLWALVGILDKFTIVDFDKTHGSDLKHLLDSFEVTATDIKLDAFEFLALKSRLSRHLHEEVLSGIDAIVSRLFKSECRVKEGKQDELIQLLCDQFYPRDHKMLLRLAGSVLEKCVTSSKLSSESQPNSDIWIGRNGKTQDTYQSSNTELDKAQEKTVDETHILIQDSALIVDANDLESRTHECASFRNDFNNFPAFDDISQILEASFDFLDSDDSIPHQKLMNSSTTENYSWASCSFRERMLQERLFYFYTKGLCKFKLEREPLPGRFVPTRMAWSRTASSTTKQPSGKKQKAVMNHESSHEFDFLSQFTLANMDINTIEVMLSADFSSQDYVNNTIADSYISQKHAIKKGKYRIVFLHCKEIYDLDFDFREPTLNGIMKPT